MVFVFRNRKEAGQKLLSRLKEYEGSPNALILAIPRGGVVLGSELAKWLWLPLDIVVSRKIWAPSNPEFAIGAIAQDWVGIFDDAMIRGLGIPPEYIAAKTEEEKREAGRRLEVYRSGKSALDVAWKTILLVDDGIATGSTARVTISFLRRHGAGKIIVVTPVMSRSSFYEIRKEADWIISLETPESFGAVGEYYASFPQVSDEEVIALMNEVST